MPHTFPKPLFPQPCGHTPARQRPSSAGDSRTSPSCRQGQPAPASLDGPSESCAGQNSLVQRSSGETSQVALQGIGQDLGQGFSQEFGQVPSRASRPDAGQPDRPGLDHGSRKLAEPSARPASCWRQSPYLSNPHVREAARRAKALAAQHGRLLFLTVFGSALYGTALPGRSDLDLRGVYLAGDPAGAERAPGLHWSSGSEEARNTEGDCDIDLMSFERWILAELPAGDTGALDLLFAPSHAGCTLFLDPLLAPVFARPLAFLRLEDGQACASYVLKQGRKYGLEGTRLGGLWRMARFLEGVDPKARLGTFLGELAASARAPAACFIDGEGALQAGGKIFESTVRAGEALRRLRVMLKEHWERIEAAREGRGVDWKALSHGLRAIGQQEELLCAGTLRFPLRFREEVLAVKTARLGFAEVEAMLVQGLAHLEALRAGSVFTGTHDPDYANSAVATVRGDGQGCGASCLPEWIR